MFTPEIVRGLLSPPESTSDKPWLKYLPYLAVLAVLLFLLAFGDKYWDANDDIHMAMIAHGYGLVDQASPGIVYSNVIWGWLAMRLGSPFGIQGYTLIAYAAMLGSAAGVGWALLRRHTPGLLAAAVLIAMFGRALLEPQFTVTAAYAAVAGLALACSLETRRDWLMAAAACLFLVVSSLIRLQECLLVCAVAAPFLLWRLYQLRGTPGLRPLLAALLAAVALAGTCKAVDHAYYSAPQWQQFRDMNALRRPFTDYAFHNYFKQRPQLLAPAGMTVTDMQMLANWFFLDDRVFNRQSLGGLMQGVSLGERLRFSTARYGAMTGPFDNPLVYMLAVTALLALALARQWPVALAAVLCLGACMVAMLMLGRPGVPRVFPGPVAVIAVLALLDHGPRLRWLALLGGAAVLLWVGANTYNYFQAHAFQARVAKAIRTKVCALDLSDLQVVWGAPDGFPDRYLYSPGLPPGGACPLHFYHVGVMALLPANLQQLHGHTGGRDLVPALLAGQQLSFLTTEDRLGLLRQYFQNHYGAKLDFAPTLSLGFLQQYQVRVEAGSKQP